MVQTFARAVEKNGHFVLADVQIDAQIGIQGVDTWTDAVHIAKLVDDGILHLQAGVLRMGEKTSTRDGINTEGLVGADEFKPVDFLHFLVEVVGVFGEKGLEPSECDFNVLPDSR